jgi:hypothetical protein
MKMEFIIFDGTTNLWPRFLQNQHEEWDGPQTAWNGKEMLFGELKDGLDFCSGGTYVDSWMLQSVLLHDL